MTQRQSLQRQVAYGHIRQSPVLKGLVELRLMAVVFYHAGLQVVRLQQNIESMEITPLSGTGYP